MRALRSFLLANLYALRSGARGLQLTQSLSEESQRDWASTLEARRGFNPLHVSTDILPSSSFTKKESGGGGGAETAGAPSQRPSGASGSSYDDELSQAPAPTAVGPSSYRIREPVAALREDVSTARQAKQS